MSDLTKWDKRFTRIANEVATWSKDPGTKVGAVLVLDRRIIATGYNGFPQNIEDTVERYSNRGLKLAYTVHAEVNAILNSAKNGATTNGSTLYVTFSPCVSCATSVVQAGVSTVVCPCISTAPERWRDSFQLGQDLLAEANVEIKTFIPKSHV
jgi:dCMP deaminase